MSSRLPKAGWRRATVRGCALIGTLIGLFASFIATPVGAADPDLSVTGTVHGQAFGGELPFTGVSLTDIAFATPSVGVAVGDRNCPNDGVLQPCGSVVFSTDDGGRTWQRRYQGPGQLNEVQMLGPDVGWAWGGCPASSDAAEPDGTCHETLLATNDGARTWAAATTPPTAAAFEFAGSSLGWSTTAPCASATWGGVVAVPQTAACRGQVDATVDGAKTWTRLATLSGPILAIDAGGGLLYAAIETPTPSGSYGSDVEVLVSADGGVQWAVLGSIPTMGLTPQVNLDFTDADDGWLTIFDGSTCAMHGCGTWGVYDTDDGGASWRALTVAPERTQDCGPGGPPILSVVSQSTVALGGGVNLGACAAPGGYVAVSRDGGTTWPAVASFHQSPQALSFVSANVGFALFSDGGAPANQEVIVATHDGGRTWSQVEPLLLPALGIDMVSGDIGFGAGTPTDEGVILRTDNAGRQWQPVADLDAEIVGLDFTSARDGWVLVNDVSPPPAPTAPSGQLLVTSDGGRQWRVATSLPQDLSQPIWVVGGTPLALVTANGVTTSSDGARTWRPTLAALGSPPCHWSLLTCTGSIATIGHVDGQLWIVAGGDGAPVQIDRVGATGSPDLVDNVPFSAHGFGQFAAGSAPDGTVWVAFTPGEHVHSALVSDDHGHTWARMRLPRRMGLATMTPNSDLADVSFISTRVGFVLTNRGLWRSIDGGRRWDLMTPTDSATAARTFPPSQS